MRRVCEQTARQREVEREERSVSGERPQFCAGFEPHRLHGAYFHRLFSMRIVPPPRGARGNRERTKADQLHLSIAAQASFHRGTDRFERAFCRRLRAAGSEQFFHFVDQFSFVHAVKIAT